MIFQQLFPLCSCTTADTTLHAAVLIGCQRGRGVGEGRGGGSVGEMMVGDPAAESQQRDERHPTSITADVVSDPRRETQVQGAGHRDECSTMCGDTLVVVVVVVFIVVVFFFSCSFPIFSSSSLCTSPSRPKSKDNNFSLTFLRLGCISTTAGADSEVEYIEY